MSARPTLLAVLATHLVTTAAPAGAQCLDELSEARWGAAATGFGSRVYVAGGHGYAAATASDRVDVYDVDTAEWSTASLSRPRGQLAATSVAGVALFAGGVRFRPHDPVRNAAPVKSVFPSDVVDLVEDSTGTWSTARLSRPRYALAAASAGGKAFFGGGYHLPGEPSDVVDIYDAATGLWSAATLSSPRGELCAAASADLVFFAGGSGPDGYSDVVDVYELSTGQWSTIQLSLARKDLAATAVGEQVYFAGGQRTAVAGSDRIDVYDAADGSWRLEHFAFPYSGLAVTTLGDRALFAGGLRWLPNGMGAQASADVHVIDAASGRRWTTGLSLRRERIAAAAVGGRALFAGGATGPSVAYSPVDTVERFFDRMPRPYCFGDGTGLPCPCNNRGVNLPGTGDVAGCRSSLQYGATLSASGCPIADGGSLTFSALPVPQDQLALLLVGRFALHGGLGDLFGDGLRCVAGNVRRLAITTPTSGVAWFQLALDSDEWQAGDVRRFQVWYRDPEGPCGTGFNLTNGLEVSFEAR